MSDSKVAAAEVLVITPQNAPFVAGSAADPAVHGATVAGIETENLFHDLVDPSDPLLQRTIDRLPTGDNAEHPNLVALTIGYMSRYQRALAAASKPPVVSSPLLAVPTLLATIAAEEEVLLVYADARLASPADVPGVDPASSERLVIVGLEGSGPFRRAVIDKVMPFDTQAVFEQVRDVVARSMASRPIGAVVLECGEMACVADRLRGQVNVPVIDYHVVIDFFRQAIRRAPDSVDEPGHC
jgi:hypothetical protein